MPRFTSNRKTRLIQTELQTDPQCSEDQWEHRWSVLPNICIAVIEEFAVLSPVGSAINIGNLTDTLEAIITIHEIKQIKLSWMTTLNTCSFHYVIPETSYLSWSHFYEILS